MSVKYEKLSHADICHHIVNYSIFCKKVLVRDAEPLAAAVKHCLLPLIVDIRYVLDEKLEICFH